MPIPRALLATTLSACRTSSKAASWLGVPNVNGLATWNVFVNLIAFAGTAADADIWTIAPDGSALHRITDAANGPGAPDNPPADQEPTFSERSARRAPHRPPSRRHFSF